MCLVAARQLGLFTRTRPSLNRRHVDHRWLHTVRYHGSPGNGIQRCLWRTVNEGEKNQRRHLATETLSTVLAPPLVFTGLLLGLWTYKCMMMVVFQNRIIYMPSMPPFARSEKIETYAAACKPVEWQVKHVRSPDATKLALCIGQIPLQTSTSSVKSPVRHIVICYFQGNGGSLPPRLPHLSGVLKLIHAHGQASDMSTRYTIVALSYRGYWDSSGRPSQPGIELDAQAVLQWVTSFYSEANVELQIILWGQSIGAGVASTALATYAENTSDQKLSVLGLILETPFVSIADMLIALYPQKWLPYRYLRPFFWNRWDSETALRRTALAGCKPKILLLSAAKDEIVPFIQTERLAEICLDSGFDVSTTHVPGALHTEASTKKDGQQALARFIVGITKMHGRYVAT